MAGNCAKLRELCEFAQKMAGNCAKRYPEVRYGHKKRVSLIYRTATTAYPCYLPVLGEFCRSWSYMTYPGTKLVKFIYLPNKMRQDASLAGNFVFF